MEEIRQKECNQKGEGGDNWCERGDLNPYAQGTGS